MTSDVGPAFQLALPGNWIRIDLDAAADRRLLDGLVNVRMRDLPELRDFEEVFLEYTSAVARAALEHDVVFAAVLIDSADDEALPVMATMAISYILLPDRSETGDQPPVEIELDDAPPETMTSVELPLGLAVRRERVSDAPPEDRERLASFHVEYVLQPDGRDYGVIVAFSSPMVPMRDGLNAMFDRIVRSLRPTSGATA